MADAADGWVEFDNIVAAADLSNPWRTGDNGATSFFPNYKMLEELLAVPIRLGLTTRSGMPAKAIDVWVSHELRRAGFGDDEVWPRATAPRVIPQELAALRTNPDVTVPVRDALFERIDRGVIKGGITSADAEILGKTYVKQVDVVISRWSRGPELMISTKRMDSSFGKNALNRIEESYGDAKNLRGRHPLGALGFLFVMRSTAFETEYDTAVKLMDLLAKLAEEPDAYDATGIVITEWTDPSGNRVTEELKSGSSLSVEVQVRHDLIPGELRPDRFLAKMTELVLERSPVALHTAPRRLRGFRYIEPKNKKKEEQGD